MKVPTKDGEVEIPQEWIDEWSTIYYAVQTALLDARLWCMDNEGKRKTKRGLRAFLGRWIRKSCAKRPQIAPPQLGLETRPTRVEPLAVRQAHLAKLRELVK